MKRFLHRERPAWLWSFLGALLVGIAASVLFGWGTAASMLSTASAFVVFTVLVGLGQMLVITSGPGNIDLSIPATIALASGVGMRVMAASNHAIVLGIVAVLATGTAIGVFNFLLIRLLRIPPIIATLSSSFVMQSLAISLGRGGAAPPPALENFALSHLGGISGLAFVALAITLAVAFVLFRLVPGRSLSALGQNLRAAHLAGVRVDAVRCLTYVSCSILAAFAGLLLAAFSGGATLDMGADYLLLSVAVVVIGGTRVAGGRASPTGVWSAACFLFLINALLNATGAGAGLRAIVYGLLIVTVTSVASGIDETSR
ncbi:ABC transporter permease [Robbsia sp. Bb-Pol-6]|uniref:ABC transporter permease n=1 Tax=Robbsia betulipollinis TaxID=2981849 RepID=A0ABT3ZT02_9BURK|nr:ABC transporter permease [Robbsia betulipollinis]MCY0389572.1 ABC transporter permease [Robbsia betulipollinis]